MKYCTFIPIQYPQSKNETIELANPYTKAISRKPLAANKNTATSNPTCQITTTIKIIVAEDITKVAPFFGSECTILTHTISIAFNNIGIVQSRK